MGGEQRFAVTGAVDASGGLLAEAIKTNGLLAPIIIYQSGVLIDGRNRLAACEIAGVAPVYQELNGHNATAFIVSANLARRNLSKASRR